MFPVDYERDWPAKMDLMLLLLLLICLQGQSERLVLCVCYVREARQTLLSVRQECNNNNNNNSSSRSRNNPPLSFSTRFCV